MPGTLKGRYIAAMILGGVGDAMGYKNGNWEFCHFGKSIYEEVESMGGIAALNIKCPTFPVSDDTVMSLATGEALIEADGQDREVLFSKMAAKYIECMKDMDGRAPGNCTMASVELLRPNNPKGYLIPFNDKAGGCGAAMRACPIGLRFPRPDQLDDLIAVSVESGRMTHHHPTGYLGAVAAALLTSYAVQNIPVRRWGHDLLETLPKVWAYVESTGHCVADNQKHWGYFTDRWQKYLDARKISNGNSDPVFPDKFGFAERDDFYKSLSFSGWGGSSGHDAPMIAYDAFLGAKGDWMELCRRGIFHGGDSDSTAILAATWFGIHYGMESIPEPNHAQLEYRSRLENIGLELYKMSTRTN